MISYVIIAFVAILIGMAISVSAFGTGGKRKKIFQDIYFSIEDVDGIGVLYTKTGEYSAILKMDNPVQKYSANIDNYYEFNHLITALAQTLGEGYAIHKQDVFVRKQFKDESNDNHEFLSESYFKYFNGRSYTDSQTYLIITQENKKSRIFSFDSKKWRDFMVKIRKVKDQLKDSGVEAFYLDGNTAREYVDRYFSMNFNDKIVSMTNFKVDEESISMGNKLCKVYSLVDVDCVSTPSIVRPFTNIEVNNVSMPVDMVSLVDSIPSADVVVYNQMFFIPNQKRELSLLDKKKNRHASMPNPSNLIAVEDIKKVQDVIARENKQLVYAHFNLVVGTSIDADIQKCTNHLENSFGRLGIHISKRAYNQLELFVNSFPGNCYSTNPEYDRFLTLSDAAACLMYKERIQHSEETPLKIYYTDRQGVPVAIDISGKEGKNKITDNSNFFCLGPSGSGKSFHMNSVVRQMWEQNTDVVMVDTGNSYEGLCEYVGGKYISYTDEHPITMNPFAIKREELNIEKIGFLKNLIMLIWKGTQGEVTKTEDRLIEQVITEYFEEYFVKKQIENMSFNTFYEYMRDVYRKEMEERYIKVEKSDFNIDNFLTTLRQYYRGGRYDFLLNSAENIDLLHKRFVVFEIDAVKDNAELFPVVTIIIMEAFINKMRRLKGVRKQLICEEAWKALSSANMASYLQYLYKTVRKYFGEAIVVTQEVDDIISSPIVKESIINNSDCKILLDQRKYMNRFDQIQSLLGLTEKEKSQILSVNQSNDPARRYKEVWIGLGGTHSAVYATEVSMHEYLAYTTEETEKMEVRELAEKLDGDMEAAIRQVAERRKEERTGQ